MLASLSLSIRDRGGVLGARKGTNSFSLFHVDGELPAAFRDEFLERIREFQFSELSPEDEEDTAHGWTLIDDLLGTDFRRDNILCGEYLCLGMRVDRWSVPSALLRAHVERRTRELMAEHGKSKLFRSEKMAIRQEMTRGLKRRTLPTAAIVDMVWALERREVRFWSQAARSVELFESLFESTFGLRLVPDGPYVAAINCGLADSAVAALAGLGPGLGPGPLLGPLHLALLALVALARRRRG